MKHYNKTLFSLAILFLGIRLSSCSIAIKAVYNQFSDEEEFVLFHGDRKAKAADRKLEKGNRKTENPKSRLEEESEWEVDLGGGFVGDSL